MKLLKSVTKLSGVRVLLRVDFNVPIKDGKVIDDFRIKKALTTISYLHKKGAIVILLAHLGEDGKESLQPVATKLKKYVPNLNFIKTSIFSDETEKILKNLKKGDVILLENIRREVGEKKNAPSFGRAMSRFGDIYVNDAFSVSHRPHASIIGITKYLPGYAGFQLEEEVKNLSHAFNPTHPFLFILGGAKFETKIPLVKKFIGSADTVFIGGAIANDFFKAKGYIVGTSLTGASNFQIPSLMKHKNLILPPDVEVIKGTSHRFAKASDVGIDECIVDIGPETIQMLAPLIEKAKFILWNGPLGKFGVGTNQSTEKVLKLIAKSSANSVIGGGDTVVYISKLKLESKFGFVSTGGGATLDFLAKGTLAGIKVLK